ncbi:MAG TPA: beta-ketoacyl synthase N-terminal-like domain-containing protein [Ktedonobacteraceae bacterium]|jgi:hypothetical protein
MDKQDFHGNEIAITGLGGSFPGADDVTSFWQNIAAGVCSIRFFTDGELLEAGVPHEVLSDPSYVKAGSFVENVDLFMTPNSQTNGAYNETILSQAPEGDLRRNKTVNLK